MIRKDLGMSSNKKDNIYGLMEPQKFARVKRNTLFGWHADSEIIFTDQKLFVLQQSHNAQNDRGVCTALA